MNTRNHKHQKDIIGIILLLLFVCFMAAVFVFVGRPMIRFISDPDKFRAWVDKNGVFGMLGYVGMIVLQIFVAIIPGEVFELYAGYAFGIKMGLLLYMIGSVLGSMAVFFFVKILGTRFVNMFFTDRDIHSLKFLRKSKKRDFLLFILFLIPGTPKDLICYYAGLTDISWKKWLFISTVGKLPSVITSILGGNALGTQDYTLAAVVLVITALVSTGGYFIYRKYTEKQN